MRSTNRWRHWRCKCGECGYTFRVYPQGVGRQQIFNRVNGLGVMLYLLGLSYGVVTIVLESLGIGIGKTSVCRAVQAVAEKVAGVKQAICWTATEQGVMGADVTSVRCGGKWMPSSVSVDAMTGSTLNIDSVPGQRVRTIESLAQTRYTG